MNSWSYSETKALAIKAARGAGMSWGLAEEVGSAVIILQRHGLPGVTIAADYLMTLEKNQAALNQPISYTPSEKSPRIAADAIAAKDEWIEYSSQSQSQSESESLCPIRLGSFLCDQGITQSGRVQNIQSPVLLAPFLLQLLSKLDSHQILSAEPPHRSATLSRHYQLTMPQQTLLITKQAITVNSSISVKAGAKAKTGAGCSFLFVENGAVMGDDVTAPAAKHSRVPASDSESMMKLNHLAEKTYAPATENSRLRGAGAGLNDND